MAEQESGRMSVREIARALGISATTVSRSLSGKGRISEETRQKVVAYVNGLGQEPAPAGQGEPAGRTAPGSLALVVPLRFLEWDLPFLRWCMGGVCRMAAQRESGVLLCCADETDTRPLERLLKGRRADGVLLTQPVRNDPCAELVRRFGLPLVALGRMDREDTLQVFEDCAMAGREMTGLLLRLGMRRIAYLGGNDRHMGNLDRLEGYRQGIRQFGGKVQGSLICTGVETREQIVDALDRLLEMRPDCLLCGDDFLAAAAVRELQLRGIPVPGQIRIASLCDSEALEQMVPSISAVHFDAAMLGATGCRMLLDALEGRSVPSRQMPAGQMILRDSTKQVR